MAFINIKLDTESLENIEELMKRYPKELEKAGVLAINRTLDMTKTRILRNATSRYTVKRRDLVNGLRLRRAKASTMKGEIQSVGRVLGLDHFDLRPKRRTKRNRPVNVAILKGNKKSLGKSAFIAYGNGFLGAFKRLTKRRLPIERLMGPSAPQMLGNVNDMPELEEFMGEKLNERFIHELNRLL